jgi:hypothetical protein
MKTYITDKFPLKELECPYMDICRDYRPRHQCKDKDVCSYIYPCELRQWFKEVILDAIPRKNLEMQIKLIVGENGNRKSR